MAKTGNKLKTGPALMAGALWLLPMTLWAGMTGSARILPAEHAHIAARVDAEIEALPVRPGQRFKKGDVLFRSECGLYEVMLNSARKEQAALKKLLESNQRLLKEGAGDRAAMLETAVRYEKLTGDVDKLSRTIADCTVTAPYDGAVVKLDKHDHDWGGRGEPVLEIVGGEQLYAEVIMPLKILSEIKPGSTFVVSIDAIGQRVNCVVESLSPVADSSSQTLGLRAKLVNPPPEIRPGMIGEAAF